MNAEKGKIIERERQIYEIANQIHSEILAEKGRDAAANFERCWLNKARNWDELSWEERTALKIKMQNQVEKELEFNLGEQK